MKFENVSLLLDAMRTKLDELGSTVEKDGELFLRQRGVLRTNCMDCLDRTNVCQSSFAKYMLESQLKAEGYDLSMQVDQQSAWFNTLWADNGDSVSKQYASTAAMKGDYTRYKTRNYRGMLNDLGFSLTRFYNGMVNDYFSQAAIDFLLGNVTSMVFQEFEAEMMTKDPAMSMLKMRESAIELCQKRVISDQKEDFVGGHPSKK
ncbi:Phosphatidylinositide phosphatase SAC2 like protein [Verticillium longisporum]|nr:Phosphatidylinositide phosphatase SAC2 like protein [Verticillium longisporum]